MRIDQLALLFALVIAANLVLLIALQLPRVGRRLGLGPSAAEAYARSNGGAGPVSTADDDDSLRPVSRRTMSEANGLPPGVYQRMARVVSFMFIGSAMVLAVVTGATGETAVIVLLAFGLILIELFGDVLPAAALGYWRRPIEAVLVLVFLTVLIFMTGGHDSPYFFGYVLLVGAAALSTSEFGGVALAIVSSVAYLAAVLLAAGGAPLVPTDLAQVAFNLISIALVMYVASVIGREQRRAREEALRLSRFDSLTRLHSRDYFMSELEQEILRATRTGRPFAAAMIDLDGLKAANDRFGHDWGDNLLKAVADVMRGDIRVTDVAARFGGDEFVLMLPETDLSGAILVAEKVRVDIARVALPHNGAVVRTSASIGIVTFPDDGRTSAELMRRADLAMYEAKRRGRDQIVRFARDSATPTPALPGGQRPQVQSPQVPLSSRPGAHVSTTVEPRPTDQLQPIIEVQPPPRPEPALIPIAIEPDKLAPTPPLVPTTVTEPLEPTRLEPEPVLVGATPAAVPSVPDVPAASAGPAPWETR